MAKIIVQRITALSNPKWVINNPYEGAIRNIPIEFKKLIYPNFVLSGI